MENRRIISDFAAGLAPSPTMTMDAQAKKLKAEGLDILSFAVGEPDFPTPAHICEAAKKAIDDGQTRYTPASGTPQCRQAIVDAAQRDLGLSYDPEQVVVSNGGKHALMNIWRTLINPGDEVIMFAPYWVSYPEQVRMAGGKPIVIQTWGDNGFQPDLNLVRDKINRKTVAILLNSPSNPAGAVFSQETIEGIARLAQSNGLMIISDEIYKHILFDNRKHFSPAQIDEDLKSRTIIADGVAKTYAMTGWRIGWMIAPKEFAKRAGNIQSQETSNPCSISQAATIAALNGPQDSVAQMRAAFEERRNYLVPVLNEIPGFRCPNPGGAFYVFPEIVDYFGKDFNGVTIEDSLSFVNYLLKQALVSTVHGSASGSEGYFRISFACSMEQLEAGVQRIKDALQ